MTQATEVFRSLHRRRTSTHPPIALVWMTTTEGNSESLFYFEVPQARMMNRIPRQSRWSSRCWLTPTGANQCLLCQIFCRRNQSKWRFDASISRLNASAQLRMTRLSAEDLRVSCGGNLADENLMSLTWLLLVGGALSSTEICSVIVPRMDVKSELMAVKLAYLSR